MEEESKNSKEPKKNTWKKAALIGSGVGMLAVNAIYGLGNYLIWKQMHPAKSVIKRNPLDYGVEYEDVEFKSIDGLTLKGWWIPSNKNEKVIIFSHAYGFHRGNMPFPIFNLVKKLIQEGYNVLMYDFRNAGESEGKKTTLAHKEQLDAFGAIEYVKTERNMKQIVLMGWSMGASTSLLAGCVSEDVQGIIADSPFSRLDTYMIDSFEYWTKLPKFMGHVSAFVTKMNFLGFKPHEVKPIDVIKHTTDKKILIIHAEDDPVIPCTESDKMKEVNELIDLWKPEKGRHIEAYRRNRKEYEQKVIEFLQSL